MAWRKLFGTPLLLGSLTTAPAALAQKTIYVPAPAVLIAPDFLSVETRLAAERLVRGGWLVKTWFFPRELGGPDDPENVAYITPQAAKARAVLIKKLERLIERDEIDRMEVETDYKGKSIIPSRIRFVARHSRGGARVEAVVEVW
jgi:hypothetical protein